MLPRQPLRRLIVILLLVLTVAFSIHGLARFSHYQGSVAGSSKTDSVSNNIQPESDGEQSSPFEVAVAALNQDLKETDEASSPAYNLTEVTNNDTRFGPRIPEHREIFSLTTRDRKFIPIFMGGMPGYNANIIPHPTKADFWIVVVQHEQAGRLEVSEQLACEAGFLNGVLICTDTPVVLPLAQEAMGTCEGDIASLVLVWGARDARLFYGPERPYIMYGAQSRYICFGQWLQDFRMSMDAFAYQRYLPTQVFETPTELRRASDFRPIEKNYFLFWDPEGRAYAHYSIWPSRSFAQINFDGSGLADLAPISSYNDQMCLSKLMPSVVKEFEAIHQATNSLSITLCRRSDPDCVPNDSNTFIMHIFHHKSYYYFHGVYEPYVVLFKQSAPFALHAIAQRPLWIHGRGPLTLLSDATQYRNDPGAMPEGQTEMFYITSMSWKSHTQKYHGYIDDVIFLAFGIEDARPGVIDVTAGDLLQDLALCSE